MPPIRPVSPEEMTELGRAKSHNERLEKTLADKEQLILELAKRKELEEKIAAADKKLAEARKEAGLDGQD